MQICGAKLQVCVTDMCRNQRLMKTSSRLTQTQRRCWSCW